MAPEMLNTIDARELVDLGLKIREYQKVRKLSDNALVKKFSDLGSTKTFSRIINDDLAELDLEKQLNSYRAVWALIDSLGNEGENAEELYDDLTPVLQLKKALFDVFKETGNARYVHVDGDTGLGKTSARRILIEKYGSRLLWVEAMECWNDNPNNFLGASLLALGQREIPMLAIDRTRKLFERLNETRVCLFIDEMHHTGPRILNTVKAVINQTPGEVVGLSMPTLWKRLERDAYEETRQLMGNRLAERIKLGLRESDISKIIRRRVPGVNGEVPQAVKMIMDRAPRYGNLAFVRDVCTRVKSLTEGTDGPDIETWSTAISQEVASR